MTDYIKREDALKAICCYLCAEDECQVLTDIPAADVVEIVRCKDCKYYGVYADGLCEAWEEITKPNGYCYVGERVNEDESD